MVMNQKRNQNQATKSSGLATISTTYSRHQRFGNAESYIAGDDGGGGGGGGGDDGFPSRRPRILTGIKNKHRNKSQPISTAESSKNGQENPNHSNNYGDNDDDSNHIEQLEGIDVDIDIAKIVFKNNGAVLEIPRHTPSPSKNHNEQPTTTTTATATTTTTTTRNPHHEDTSNSKRQILTEVKENESSNSNNRNNYFNYYYVTPNSHEFRTEISHPPPPSATFTPPSRIAWQSQPPQPLQNTGKSITKVQQLVSPKISSFNQNTNYEDGREKSAYGHFSPRPIQPPPLSTFQSSAVAPNFNSNSQSNLGSIYPIHILTNHKQLNTHLNQNRKPPNSIQDKLEGQVSHGNGQRTQNNNGIQQNQNYGSSGNKFYSPSSPTGISDGSSGLDYHSLNAGPQNSKFVHPKMESGFRPNTFPIPLNKLKNVHQHQQSSRPPLVHVAELVLNLNNNSNRKATTPIVVTGSNYLISNPANSHNFPVPVYQFYPAANNNNHQHNFVGINNDPDQDRDHDVDGGPPPRLHLNGFGHGHGHGFGLGHLSNGGGLNSLNSNGGEGEEGGVGEGGRGITGLHPQGGIHLPRYGYLIYNAKRGPPFYIIPEEEFHSTGTGTDQAQSQFSKLNSNLSGFGPERLPGLGFISNGLSNNHNHKHEFERGIHVGSNQENRVIKPRNDNGR